MLGSIHFFFFFFSVLINTIGICIIRFVHYYDDDSV